MGCEHEPPTLVCFAVKEEAAAFKQFARGWPAVELLLTGMGEKNAERAIRSRLSQGKPKLVLSCGFAGGLAPQLAGGTLVFDAEDQPALRTLWLKAGAQPARFYCAHRVAITTEEKQALRESTGADAVEMESKAICALCRAASIPCATLRVILDTASETLPIDFNRLFTPNMRMDYRKLAVTLAKSPGTIANLLRLQKQSVLASKALGEILGRTVRILGP